jgi:3-dehydroquinate dehydratase-1
MQEYGLKHRPCIVASLGRDAVRDAKRAAQADIIEVRLDLVDGDPLEAIRSIRGSTSLPIIATNRWRAEGGRFNGSEEERIELLCKASDHADLIDIELRSRLRAKLIRQIDRPAIVSYHDFSGMPDQGELRSILLQIEGTGGSIAKIAVTPARLKDNLMLLDLLMEAGMPLCVIAMGEIGRHLRAVAPIYGSALTYGYISEATAPGQISVADLKEALRILNSQV